LPFIIERINDNKFSEQLYKIVANICNRIPAKFVIGHIIRYVRSTEGKKPKLNGDTCLFITKIVEIVSLKICNLREIAEYAK